MKAKDSQDNSAKNVFRNPCKLFININLNSPKFSSFNFFFETNLSFRYLFVIRISESRRVLKLYDGLQLDSEIN